MIVSDIVAEDGHDFAPHYLPDGRIVFASTRQRQSRAVLLDEGKPQFAAHGRGPPEPAFVLHVMNADGSGIRQLSFNQSHDLDPAVLADGRIVFSRWDNAGSNGRDAPLHGESRRLAAWSCSTARTATRPAPTASTVQFLDPRPMADGRVLALVRPYAGTELGGDLLAIDVANYVERHAADPPESRRARRPRAASRHGERRHDHRRALAGRALQRRLSPR